MTIIRPRLTDYHQLSARQEDLDFAIPFVNEDIPLYVDPFLLWKSPSQQDQALHLNLLNAINGLVAQTQKGKEQEVRDSLIIASECSEAGLGTSKTRAGIRIGEKTANEIIQVFRQLPKLSAAGFTHFEEIQLYADHISKDRISDFACSFLKSFLIDFTIDQCKRTGFPMENSTITHIYDNRTFRFKDSEQVTLPVNPSNKRPILLIPKRWLRFSPWINYDDYFQNCFVKEAAEELKLPASRVEVLNFNRQNYDLVGKYIAAKEKTFEDCKNDPLFKPIPIASAKAKWSSIKALKTGKEGNADKKYEDAVAPFLASTLYPHLDFADTQVRTDSGAQIRDLIFYNNKSTDFLEDIWNVYGSRQLVFELKNVAQVEREHINQLHRYLSDSFGRFGVLVTRNPLPRAIFQHTIDIWSGHRKCIIALTDSDIELMASVFESKQRLPIEVLKKKFIEFGRACPS